MNNKKTFLLINAIQRATGDDALELRRWLNDPEASPDSKIPAVTAIFERLGLKTLSDETIEAYNALALEALSRTSMSHEAKQAFTSLINRLTNRKS